MSNYIDLVLCQQPRGAYLFYAPAFTNLKEGQSVIVDTKLGEMPAKVITTYTVNKDSEAYKFILKMLEANGATLPFKRVLAKVDHSELKYEEDTDGTDNN